MLFFFRVKNLWFLIAPQDTAWLLPSAALLSGGAEALRPGERCETLSCRNLRVLNQRHVRETFAKD